MGQHQFKPLFEAWKDPDAFAGYAGVGAEEACMGTAAELEHPDMCKHARVLLAIDVYTAFDQLNRGVAVALLARAGMPKGIPVAY
eukprot:4160224-Alexandrium_andersonii.AAC.1